MRNLNKLLKPIFAMIILINIAYALQEDKISSVMRQKVEESTKVLQNKELSKDSKHDEIFKIFDSVFDYELMSKLSLGKQWNSLNKEQKELFTNSFENKLKNSYVDKLDLYTNQEVIVKDSKKIKSSRIELTMQVIGDKETLDIIYKFYKDSNDHWFIYDVNILGVSIIQTYRNQFVGVLQKGSFEELLEKLNKIEVATN